MQSSEQSIGYFSSFLWQFRSKGDMACGFQEKIATFVVDKHR